MSKVYIVVGSKGALGCQIFNRLKALNKFVFPVFALDILKCKPEHIIMDIDKFLTIHSICLAKANIGVILAHRCENIDISLLSEIRITRDFVWSLAQNCCKLRVVVLGSVTGRLVDRKMSEAYHYSKDLQKSIVRQSIRILNLDMILVELYWFVKYQGIKATYEYQNRINRVGSLVGENNFPTVESIVDLCCSLIEMTIAPRGHLIPFDGGLSLLQEDHI